MRKFVLALAILMSAAAFSTAEAAKRVALVIGNNDYAEISRLKKAVNDARAISATLETIGFHVDLGENLTRRQTNEKIAAFIERIDPGDTAFFFFSGHGVAPDGQNILLPVDVPATGNADVVRDEAHVVDELLDRVRRKGAGVSFFVLDACRNNPFATTGGKGFGTRGLQMVAPPSGSFVLMAAGAGQEALDRLSETDPEPTSVFTRHLIPLLTTPGLSHISLAKRIQSDVDEMAATVGHAQQPAFYDQIKGEIVLVPDGTEVAAKKPVPATDTTSASAGGSETKAVPEADPALAEWNAIKQMESIGILQQFAGKYPDSIYASYARIRIEEIEAQQKAAQQEAERARQREIELAKANAKPEVESQPATKGGWFVIVGSYPHSDSAKARSRAGSLASKGFNADIINTNDYANLRDGLYSVVIGPYKKSAASNLLSKVKRHVPDAYIKEAY